MFAMIKEQLEETKEFVGQATPPPVPEGVIPHAQTHPHMSVQTSPITGEHTDEVGAYLVTGPQGTTILNLEVKSGSAI